MTRSPGERARASERASERDKREAVSESLTAVSHSVTHSLTGREGECVHSQHPQTRAGEKCVLTSEATKRVRVEAKLSSRALVT